jgi:hypothetical protein
MRRDLKKAAILHAPCHSKLTSASDVQQLMPNPEDCYQCWEPSAARDLYLVMLQASCCSTCKVKETLEAFGNTLKELKVRRVITCLHQNHRS